MARHNCPWIREDNRIRQRLYDYSEAIDNAIEVLKSPENERDRELLEALTGVVLKWRR